MYKNGFKIMKFEIYKFKFYKFNLEQCLVKLLNSSYYIYFKNLLTIKHLYLIIKNYCIKN